MQYTKVVWLHNNDAEPVLLYSELDQFRREVRKVELFRDGLYRYADKAISMENTELSSEPLPSLEYISAQPEFVPFSISKEEFDAVWLTARQLRKR